MITNQKLIAFSGGGTAGHVYPAFPVIRRLKQAGFEILWIGSESGMERDLVERSGIRFVGIPAGKLRRYFSFRNFVDLFRIAAGLLCSWRILRREKPALLFSKGGFVSVPPVAAARFLGIRIFTHESDADPGLATRLNISLGARVLIPYESTRAYLPRRIRDSALVTGNPVRDDLFDGDRIRGRILAGLNETDRRPLILVLGGSLGAREVNDLVVGSLDTILNFAAVVHQTGPGNPQCDSRYGYFRQAFFNDELPHLLAAADLAIARSGAGTLWELAATGTPAIFVPLRGATRGDQLLNAHIAEQQGMAVILKEGSDSKALSRIVLDLLSHPETLSAMAGATSAFPARESADRIVSILMEASR